MSVRFEAPIVLFSRRRGQTTSRKQALWCCLQWLVAVYVYKLYIPYVMKHIFFVYVNYDFMASTHI